MIKININKYFMNHKQKPRGFGYWVFSFDSNGIEGKIYVGQSNYSDAVKRAKLVASCEHVSELYLQP